MKTSPLIGTIDELSVYEEGTFVLTMLRNDVYVFGLFRV